MLIKVLIVKVMVFSVVKYEWGFPGGSDGKESACSAEDLGSILGLGRSPGGRKWQPTPVFLPGKSHEQRRLLGYSPWGCRIGHDWVIDTLSQTWVWELDHKECWAPKNWYFWTVLEKTLESPLDSKGIKPINPKGNKPWVFLGRNDAKVEAPILWPLMQRADSLEKSLMLGKIEGIRRRRQQRMRWLDSITDSMDMDLSKLRDSEGQGNLACCSPRGCKESDTTKQQNSNSNHVCVHAWSVAQLCLIVCDPMDCPRNFPRKNTEVGCHFFLHGIFPI